MTFIYFQGTQRELMSRVWVDLKAQHQRHESSRRLLPFQHSSALQTTHTHVTHIHTDSTEDKPPLLKVKRMQYPFSQVPTQTSNQTGFLCCVDCTVSNQAYSEYKHVLANILRSLFVARTPPVEARSPDCRSNVENAPRRGRSPAGIFVFWACQHT